LREAISGLLLLRRKPKTKGLLVIRVMITKVLSFVFGSEFYLNELLFGLAIYTHMGNA